ncbi:MAG TPA: polar localization protein TipN [Caulobacteraceae bacterium]|nr:polar localization protein TipN [Caulobacteraceae bacterium]
MAPPRSKPLSFTSIKVGALPQLRPADTDADASPANVQMPVRAQTTEPAAAVRPAPLAAPLEASAVLTRIAEPKRSGERGIYLAAAVASLVWLGGVGAIGWGLSQAGRSGLDTLEIAVLAMTALAPLGLIWSVAYAVSQARTLAGEARRARRLTDELIGPTALAAAQSGAVVEAMRSQIATASEVANQAREHLAALSLALAQETEHLAEATAHASRTAVGLVETLSRERGELNTLAITLDARSAAVTDAINRQAHMVAEASDLAETQLREAEAALAARAADLAAAAGEAVDVSRIASEDLGRQIARLETASGGVGDQMRALEDGLTQQRAALVTVAHALRAEQEDFSTLAESRTAQLAEFVNSARSDVVALNQATAVGASSLSDLIAEARAKLGELAEAASTERDAFARSAEDTLKGLSEAGAREREHLETAMRSTIEALSAAAVEAREAADVHAEAARARVDLLNEAAFAAGQKADQVFDTRLTQARGLIEQSAQLVEDAGLQAAQRLESQVADARAALESLHAVIDDVANRAARLPEETGARAAEVKAAVETGLGDLLESARRASEETQAIDAAFQERVKRNYEMLSEAVQLMGVVADRGAGAAALQRPSPAERARGRLAASQPRPRLEAPSLEPATEPQAAPAGEPVAALPTLSEPNPVADAGALRGRLRLTPTASDDEFKAAFEAAGGQAPVEETGGWTWKELLTSLDGPVAADGSVRSPASEAGAADGLFAEIEAMGIDPAALLTRGRIEEIAAAIQTGDALGAREVVRTLAPAAIRRIARRALSDPGFRARAHAFVANYADVIADAAASDREGLRMAQTLASNGGRAFLLLDAATGLSG